jgi:(2R)-sulfolactate sulfo-lyase subunit alpha
MIEFRIHEYSDNVGVAVVETLKKGAIVNGRSVHGSAKPRLKSLSDIPLGHKIALQDFKVGDTIIKYGVDIGKVVAPIKKGEHVHVHNVKTKRW